MCLDTEKQVQACIHLFKSYSTLKSLLFFVTSVGSQAKHGRNLPQTAVKSSLNLGLECHDYTNEENSHCKQGDTCSAYE